MDLKQKWPKPSKITPIVIIGAGGIVNDAHLPAYKQSGFPVHGIFDLNLERAQSTAEKWDIKHVFSNLDAATKSGTAFIYDIALPPTSIASVLEQIPVGSTVLIQKPMGSNFVQAQEILRIAQERDLNAAINFQLRFSPQMLAVRDAINHGLLGDLLEIEVHLNVNTPWHLFPFLKSMDRVEIAVHSIHYLDLIRSIVGKPKGVFARTMSDPRSADMAQTRTTAILDYGSDLRCVLSINHNHQYSSKFQDCQFRFEGTKGAMMTQIGINLNYPVGEPDELWFATPEADWKQIDLQGSWFIDAFVGIMSNVQRFHNGEDQSLFTSVEDCIETMSLVEACFEANNLPSHKLPEHSDK